MGNKGLLYCFGHGLSYTTFAYSHLKIDSVQTRSGNVTVSFDVTNTGNNFHQASQTALNKFLQEGKVDYICGHNLIHHDARYLQLNGTALYFGISPRKHPSLHARTPHRKKAPRRALF